MTFVRAYLRASTEGQDATRALDALESFAVAHGVKIAARYVENESGSSLIRPQLFRLLNDCHRGDVLLVEQIDRLSRLNAADWERLKSEITARGVVIVSLDLPTSWQFLRAADGDELQTRFLAAINGMMLDLLAAIARKDLEDRKRRQAEGIAKAKARNVYKGRPEQTDRNAGIAEMLEKGMSYSKIIAATGACRATVAKVAKRAKEAA